MYSTRDYPLVYRRHILFVYFLALPFLLIIIIIVDYLLYELYWSKIYCFSLLSTIGPKKVANGKHTIIASGWFAFLNPIGPHDVL